VAVPQAPEIESGRHPIIRVVAAAALLALAAILIAIVAGSRARTWAHWQDDRTGVAGRYPAAWHRESFDDNLGLATHTGMVFSNVPHHFEYPDLPEGRSTSAWDYEDLPDDAVVVEVSKTVRFDLTCKRTTLPLSLSDGNLSRDKPAYGAPPRLFIPGCIEGRNGIGVHVLVFPDASPRDVRAVRTFVGSIRPLETG
jgi:hypothetical protein